MKKIVYSLIIVLIVNAHAYSADWFDTTNSSIPPVKANKFMDMLNRSDKWRTSPDWRYKPYVTHRYCYDCSYYRYVNCKDVRFSRCWQCKNYMYKYELGDR